MIGLVDFLAASGVALDKGSAKVHLACFNGREHPIDVYFAGYFNDWQAHQAQRNFPCRHVLSLIDIGAKTWLFVGVYEVLDVGPHPKVAGQYLYSLRLLPGQEEVIGRVIVEHARTRQSYVWLKPEIELPIIEIRREKLTVGEFPGYNAVVIPHATLRLIIQQKMYLFSAPCRLRAYSAE